MFWCWFASRQARGQLTFHFEPTRTRGNAPLSPLARGTRTQELVEAAEKALEGQAPAVPLTPEQELELEKVRPPRRPAPGVGVPVTTPPLTSDGMCTWGVVGMVGVDGHS